MGLLSAKEILSISSYHIRQVAPRVATLVLGCILDPYEEY